MDGLGTENWTAQEPNIGRGRHRRSNRRSTEDWTKGGCRRPDGFWLVECLVVEFLGFGVWIVELGLKGDVLREGVL